MSTAYGEAKKGKLRFGIFNKVGQYVGLHMVYTNKRHIERQRQRFGKLGAYQQRTDETRRLGKGNGMYRLQQVVYRCFVYIFASGLSSFLQSGMHYRHDVLHMG